MEEILSSYVISVNVCSISKVKASDILIHFAKSFLLRLPRKILHHQKVVIVNQTKVSIFNDFLCQGTSLSSLFCEVC